MERALIGGQTVLAVIPARGGSKRCPRKNIRRYKGKSLIAWAVEAAKGSRYIDWLFCSTDDAEMAQEAMYCDCPVMRRPEEIATDEASNEDVLRHVLKTKHAQLVVLLQPTSPLRTAEDIDACLELVAASEVNLGCISYSRGNWQKNGAVYAARREWIEKHDFSHAGLLKYFMPEERSLDIDYASDFDR